MNKLWKKLIAGIFVFALVLSGMSLIPTEGNKVNAAEESAEEETVKYYVQPYTGIQVTAYKDADTAPVPTPPAGSEKYNDWIFAGWFTNEACSSALTVEADAETTYYAKYVPAEVLSVKMQVTAGTTAEKTTSDMRLVATVDSLHYKKVGFEVYYNGSTTPIIVSTKTVYERIEAAKNGVEYDFSPNIFDLQSEYFITATLNNIANKNFDKGFYIKPYWVTLDGTTVYGVGRYARVEDSYLNIVNVPVRLVSDATTATTGTINVAYNTEYFTYADAYASTLLNETATSTPGYANGEVFDSVTVDGTTTAGTVAITGTATEAQKVNGEVAHLRLQVAKDPEDDTKFKTLPKKNIFTVTSSDLTTDIVVVDAVYNYFRIATAYNSTLGPDTSWYDANETEFVITTPEELYGLAKKVNTDGETFSGKTVYLGSNIALNKTSDEIVAGWIDGTVNPDNYWVAIGKLSAAVPFKGVFDGQEHTISGMYANSNVDSANTNRRISLFSYAENATFKNLKIVDSYVYSKYEGASVISQGINLTIENIYSDATINGYDYQAGGIAGAVVGGSISNCWMAGDIISVNASYGYSGGILAVAGEAKMTITNCLFSGTITGARDIGAFVGQVQNEAIIEDCLTTGTITGTRTDKQNETGLAVGRVYGGALIVEDIYAMESGSYNPVGSVQNSSTLTNKAGKTVANTAAATTFTDKATYSGYNASENMAFDFDNVWVVRQSDTPVLNNWCESGALYVPKTDWTGSGTEEDPYIIKTAEQLYGLANSVNAGTSYEGKYFELGANITINSGTASRWEDEAPKYNWIPIGTSVAVTFKGHFNTTGLIREIKGIYVNAGTVNHAGLFGSATDGTIKNIKVTNSYIKGNQHVAAISGFTNGVTVDNVYTNAIVVGASTANTVQVAGIVGYQVKGTVKNSWFDGAVTGVNSSQYVGGVVGRITDGNGAVIDNCLATGTVTSGRTSGNAYAGGILGGANRNTTVSNCFSALNNTLTTGGATGCVGSVVGGTGTAGYTITVVNCYAASGVYTKANGTGGNGTVSGTSTILTNYTGGYAYLNTYLEFDRHEDALPENEQHDGVWVAREGKAPGLKIFVSEEDRMELVNQNMYRADTRWYNTTDTEFTIDTAEELVGFASLVNGGTSFADKTVQLGADIAVNVGKATDWSAGKNNSKLFNFTPIAVQSSKKYFDGEFDGQGYAIDGLYINQGTGAALFGQTAVGSKVTNLRMLNTYITGNQGLGSMGGWYCYGTFDTIYSDAIIYNNSTGQYHGYYGGIVGLAGSGTNPCTIRNCWFDGSITATKPYAGGIAGSVNGTDNVVIEGCLNTGTIKASSQVGGLVGRVSVNFDLKDSLNTGIVSGNKQIGNIIGYTTATTVEVDCDRVYALGEDSTLDGGLGTLSGTVEGVAELTGANGFLNTWLTFDRPELPTPTTGYWVAVADDTPVLKSFLGDATRLSLEGQNMYRVDTRWYDEEETEFTITTAEQLIGFANLVNGGTSFADKTVALGADIVVNTGNADDWASGNNTSSLYPWAPIGTTTNPFDGKFNTDNDIYEISGLYATSSKSTKSAWYIGLFGYVKNAEVKNIKVLNSYIQAEYYAGAIVGTSEASTVDTVYANAIVKATTGNSGGVLGSIVGGTLSQAWFDGSITNPGQYTGGIVGVSQGEATINNCLATGSVTSTTSKANAYAGGIVGGATGTTTVSGCLSALESFSVKTATASGSVAGGIGIAGVTASVTNSYAVEEIYTKTHGTGNGTFTATVTAVDDFTNYKGYMNTALDFDNVWVAMEESAPMLQVFAPTEGVFDTTSWFTKAVADGEGNVAGTEANPYIIDSLADLYGLTKRVKDGNTFESQYIKLTKSIVANTVENEDTVAGWATEAPYYVWSPIGGNPNTFKGHFDGEMNTVSGLYATGSYGTKNPTWYTGLFGYVTDATIENVKVEDSYFTAAYYTAGVVGYVVSGTVDSVYSNATTVGTSGHTGTIVGAIVDGTIQNSWSDGNATAPNYVGGIAGYATTGTCNILHCLNTGEVTATTAEAGGIVGRGSATLTIDDCLSVGTITAPSRRGSIIAYLTVSATITSCYGYSENGIGAGGAAVKLNSLDEVYDVEAYERLDSEYWTAKVGAVPVPSVFATAGNYATAAAVGNSYVVDTDLAGTGAEADPYLIGTAAELYGLAVLSQTDSFEGKVFKLTEDITINHQTLDANTTEATSYEWLPIGSSSVPFKGTFNGDGHTISGLYKNFDPTLDKSRWTGLFDTTEGCIVENLNIDNTYFTYIYNGENKDPSRMGSIAGYGGGTFRNISSTASLINEGRGTGGIIGQSTTDTTIINCWFGGEAVCVTTFQSSYLGGLIGFATAGNVSIQHSHVSGDVLGGSYHVGGLVGNIQGGVQATITDSLFSGNFKASDDVSGDVFRHGQLVGTLVANANSAVAGMAPTLEVNNSYGVNNFASYDIGALTAYTHTDEATSTSTTYTPTVTGRGYVSVKNDRLIGYIASDLYEGDSVPLDFAGGTWVLTKESAPKLSVFATDEEIYDASQLEDLFKLSTFGKSLQDAEDTGAGHYTVKITGKTIDDYNNYCGVLEAGIFDAYNNDQSTTLNGEGVYNMIYTSAANSDAANDDWVVNVTYVDGTITITITTAEKVLSQHLKAESIQPYTTTGRDADDGYTATSPQEIKFHMVEQKYDDGASSYIIQLENGHFIVIDGGIDSDAPYLMEYLESLVPEDGKKPIVEAWIFSHAHYDHVGTLSTFVTKVDEGGNKVYKDKIYVEGIYYNEANDKLLSDHVYKESSRQDGHHHWAHYINRIGSVFKTTKGAEPQIYRMYTGQQFTFDTVVMEVMLGLEQFDETDYKESSTSNSPNVFNETSTWTMFYLNGKKLLTAGDSNILGKTLVKDAYSESYLTVDVFTALHHGTNINRESWIGNEEFESKIKVTGAVLYSYPLDWLGANIPGKTTMQARIRRFMDQQIENGMTGFATTYESGSTGSNNPEDYFYHGQGTVVLTFGDSITANVKAHNDWVNEYAPAQTTTEE